MMSDIAKPRSRNWLAVFALTAAVLFWSGNFIAGRAISGGVPPLELNILRWSICLALMLPFTARRMVKHRLQIRESWRLVVLLGLTGIAAFHWMVYQALSLTTAVNCLLILALGPVATFIGGMIWNGFRPSALQVLGLVVSVVGAAVLILDGSVDFTGASTIDRGMLWMVGAVLVWAWYTLLLRQKKTRALPQDVTLAASIVVALVFMLAALLFRGVGEVHFTPTNALAILYIAVFASLIGFLFWSYGISEIGAEQGGQFVHLMPVFGSVLAVIILGEAIETSHFIGAFFIITGIVLVNRRVDENR